MHIFGRNVVLVISHRRRVLTLYRLYGTVVLLVFQIGWRFIERCEHFCSHSMFLTLLTESILHITEIARIFILFDYAAELAVRPRICRRWDLVTDFGSRLRLVGVMVLLMHDRTDTCLFSIDIRQPAAIALCCCIETLMFNGRHWLQSIVTSVSRDLPSPIVVEHGADFCRRLLLALVFWREIHGNVHVIWLEGRRLAAVKINWSFKAPVDPHFLSYH